MIGVALLGWASITSAGVLLAPTARRARKEASVAIRESGKEAEIDLRGSEAPGGWRRAYRVISTRPCFGERI